MRKLSAKQYAESLIEMAKGKSQKDIDECVHECITVLARQGKAKIIHCLEKELRAIIDAAEGVRHITVVLAHKNAKDEKDVAAHLQDLFGKKADITISHDLSLIGGMIVRADDRVVDASISHQLQKLRATIRIS